MRRSRAVRLVAAGAAAAVAMPLAGCAGDGSAQARRQDPQRKPARTAKPSKVPGLLAGMGPEQKVGQLFVPTVAGRAAGQKMIKRYHLGGVIYFPRNARTPRGTAALSNALQKASKVPLLIGVDEEQGLVTRLPYITRFPGNMALGATRRPDDARAAARVTGAELRAVGINQNYAPVADVNVDPANPVIGIRSFGSDPGLVADMTGAAIRGYQQAGVAATAKHFPGHGDTATDSHTGLPVINHTPAQWNRIDAPPFKSAVKAGADAIMSAHIVVPRLDRSGDPATLSPTVLTGLLRRKLGFRGVAVTDSLEMAGARRKYDTASVAVRAVKAGADQLLMPPDLPTAYKAVLRAVRAGRISKARLDEAVTRILRLKEARGLLDGARADPARADAVVGAARHRATVRTVAEHSITVARDRGLVPLRGKKAYVTGPQGATLAAALRRAGVRTTGAASAADVAVVTTKDAGAATAARLRAAGGRPTVAVALGSPYDLAHAGNAAATVATYSSSTASLAALARVLAGSVRPTGRLPVDLR